MPFRLPDSLIENPALFRPPFVRSLRASPPAESENRNQISAVVNGGENVASHCRGTGPKQGNPGHFDLLGRSPAGHLVNRNREGRFVFHLNRPAVLFVSSDIRQTLNDGAALRAAGYARVVSDLPPESAAAPGPGIVTRTVYNDGRPRAKQRQRVIQSQHQHSEMCGCRSGGDSPNDHICPPESDEYNVARKTGVKKRTRQILNLSGVHRRAVQRPDCLLVYSISARYFSYSGSSGKIK